MVTISKHYSLLRPAVFREVEAVEWTSLRCFRAAFLLDCGRRSSVAHCESELEIGDSHSFTRCICIVCDYDGPYLSVVVTAQGGTPTAST